MANLIENCRISPATSEVTELTLPLSYFDVVWTTFHSIKRLLFFEFPCSKSTFIETIVPDLKQSLSITLKHYIPLAGHILYPKGSANLPEFRYLAGDSVSLTIAESNEDFGNLTGNHVRDADQFYPFVPKFPPSEDEPDRNILPVLALQVTLFPNHGLCIGFNNHHGVGDASSIVGFIKAWASVNKFSGDSGISSLVFDRSFVKDPKGIAAVYWNQLKQLNIQFPEVHFPTSKFRATYVLHPDDIQKLKNAVLSKRPNSGHASTFTVVTAYVWSCLAKSDEAIGDKLDLDEPEYFAFAVDCRARQDPPIPSNYFGNCIGLAIAKTPHRDLIKDDGFLYAAEAISEEMINKVNKKGELLKGAENWFSDFIKIAGKRIFGVAGSPKYDLYDVDYGWDRPKKLETISIDGENSISLCKSREYEGGLEIGLSHPKAKMDALAVIFTDGLKNLEA